jgi:hypothetical protein
MTVTKLLFDENEYSDFSRFFPPVSVGVVTYTAHINPYMMKQMLSFSFKDNRNMRPHHVDAFKRDIMSGSFKLSDQGASFDVTRQMTNCIHRGNGLLAADAENPAARYWIPMLINFNMPIDSRDVSDAPLPRTPQDQMRMGGYTYPACAVGLVRRVYQGTRTRPSDKLTLSEILRFIKTYEQAVRDTCTWMPPTRYASHSTQAPVCRALICGYDPGKIQRFCDVFRDGGIADKSAGEDSISRLCTWYAGRNHGATAATKTQIYNRVATVLYAYLTGRSLPQRVVASTQELFLIPRPAKSANAPKVIDVGDSVVELPKKPKIKPFRAKDLPAATDASDPIFDDDATEL